MKTNYFIILSILLSSIVLSKPDQNDVENKIIDKVIYLTYNCQFDNALKIVEKSQIENPISMQWKYFKGMIYYREWLFAKTFARHKDDIKQRDILLQKFFDEFGKVAVDCEEMLKNNSNDTTALFYCGASYGYMGIYYAKKGELFKAATEGKKGIDLHEKLIKICPNWTDVYLSAGMFNFYASDVPWYKKPILWILGKSGDEEKAYQYLKLVFDNGNLAKYEAMELLLELFVRRNDNNSAEVLYDKLITQFPDSRFYYTAKTIWDSWDYKDLDLAVIISKKCISFFKSSAYIDIDKKQLGIIYILLANTCWKQNNNSKAIECWQELINNKFIPEEEDWQKLVLADKYLECGKKSEAIKLYKEISNSEKDNYSKEKAIQALKKINEN